MLVAYKAAAHLRMSASLFRKDLSDFAFCMSYLYCCFSHISALMPRTASNISAYSVETERLPLSISFNKEGDMPICPASFLCDIPRYSIST